MEADPNHPQILVMGEFFFKKLRYITRSSSLAIFLHHPLSEQGVQTVASWTKKETPRGVKRNINIFEYGYIVVVINWEEYESTIAHILLLIHFPFSAITGFWLSSSIQPMLWTSLVILRVSYSFTSVLKPDKQSIVYPLQHHCGV
jgi:hypothetical protein